MKEGYCPRCSCHTCVPENTRRREDAAKRKALAEDREARERDRTTRLKLAEEERFREGAMIWMLVNARPDTNQVIFEIAEALDLTTNQVNSKRAYYVRELEKRTMTVVKDGADDPAIQRLHAARAIGGTTPYSFWAKIPGSRGTDLP